MIIQPVILCGGSGTRLWPLSREQYPKQLLCLNGNHTMLQATALRLDGVALAEGDVLAAPLLVGNEEYRFLIAEQLRQVGVAHPTLVLEPCGRNTAPALTLAALAAQGEGSDPVLVIMPADHVIQDETAFRKAVMQGAALAEQGKLVTFGIKPTAPETGYGYIKQGAALADGACLVDQFVEKPDAATAESYLASGRFLWNGGIFVIKASVWLAKMAQCRADITAACLKAYEGRQQDHDFLRPAKEAFADCPSDSIDYAVMERLAREGANTGEVAVVPLDARWSDVGAWSALWEIGDKDAGGNVLMGDVLSVDSQDTLVVAEDRLVACIGLKNIVVVETADAILVADRSEIQKVKEVVGQLKAQKRSESLSHRKVFRPWGWYDSIDFGERFQVKRIVVNPGACLSLQMHHHRAEHWIVVSGTAKVTRGEETLLVSENQSTYIPLGTKHRLENPGKLPLEMIEVQSGSYLGEDDIVRFEDIYGR
ncbi:mannose-1-phosphate guanylyltransferase/mannose-6-phosphate isomerase [Dechloromonas sp. TW-R-39-2]|uniref:mannose-1-phosphate guanylyltransferase/mannose-6-phosphate isomerase n=1 Tax=Dechloromonas sp. TW-R-39-2 TaxID=2654218 RepID=UPI00193E332D|nr:mannose-1-phosphate guanylyltransferase/mannose-6-phosphate isomerase [Dechloromonas sp. TW-R-39-2]QRM20048.1 mannose-1-phosphate guanylyltransferase/mannose-6-phosphate isomerase [Dechloromonas sp. TW-R-39-2]